MSDFPGPWGSLLVGSWLVHGYLHGHLDFSVWKSTPGCQCCSVGNYPLCMLKCKQIRIVIAMPVVAPRSEICDKTSVKNSEFYVLSLSCVVRSWIFRTRIFKSLPLTMRAEDFPV